jgi:SsrA-binding protein
MAEPKNKKGLISHGIAAQNRKARFDYAIKDTVEAGLVLKGPEVKSLRHGRATLSEAWAGERDGEMWLFNAYIPEYQGGVLSRFEPRAPRKLLLKRLAERYLPHDIVHRPKQGFMMPLQRWLASELKTLEHDLSQIAGPLDELVRIGEAERTLAWNDPDLKIDWQLSGDTIVSEKDQRGTSFRDAEKFE